MNCIIGYHEIQDANGFVGIDLIEKDIKESNLSNQSLLEDIVKECFQLVMKVNTDQVVVWITNNSHDKNYGSGKFNRVTGSILWR